MAVISNSGVNIYFEDHGSRNSTTLFLSHGYGGSSNDWKGQVHAFKENFRVIVWDMRGHGQSESPNDPAQYSRELTISDMEAILDECGVEKAVMGGMSMGGYMTLFFNMKKNTRVQGLLLCGTGPGFKKDEAREKWNSFAHNHAENLEAEIVGKSAYQNGTDKSSIASLEGLAKSARGMLAQKDSSVYFSLPEITVPTLIVVGSKDELFLRAADYMASKIQNSRKVVIAGADHYVNIDGKSEFNSIIESYLSEF